MSTPTQALSPIRSFNRTPLQSRQLSGSTSNLNPNPIPPGPSPAYTTNLRSRHALYGTDDRVVLDLGSKVWKAGFSSETKPRIVISTQQLCSCESLWNLSSSSSSSSNSNSNSVKVSQDLILLGLRKLFFDHLMVDPKMRKVLLIESALIPIEVRSQISLVLFEYLHVPSISFTPSSVLVLLATGTVTGLVIDVGHLETSALPVYLSRPLFPLVRSTTRASSRLNSRLKALLLRFAPFIPIPKFGQSSNSSSTAIIDRKIPVPREFLTSEVIEDIKTRLLFVSKDPLRPLSTSTELLETHVATNSPTTINPNDSIHEYSEETDTVLLDSLERHYKHSTSPETIDITYKLPTIQTSTSNPRAPCMGVIKIPGWIRERAAEILFTNSHHHQIHQILEEEEESLSITEVVLECLANLPIDLRKPLVSNLVIAGGGAMIPGFIPRLKTELIQLLESSQLQPQTSNDSKPSKSKRGTPKYNSISSLSTSIHILNDPHLTSRIPPLSLTRPASFQPHLLSWIGGSLAGSMRIGGQEVIREHWDSVIEASLVSQEFAIEDRNLEEIEEDGEEEDWERRLVGLRIACGILPDWTKIMS